jgi:hypothetical protein
MMETHEHHFESDIRSKLSSFSEEPSPEVWERISAGLATKHKRRILWLIPFSLVSFFLITGLFFHIYDVEFGGRSLSHPAAVKIKPPFSNSEKTKQSDKAGLEEVAQRIPDNSSIEKAYRSLPGKPSTESIGSDSEMRPESMANERIHSSNNPPTVKSNSDTPNSTIPSLGEVSFIQYSEELEESKVRDNPEEKWAEDYSEIAHLPMHSFAYHDSIKNIDEERYVKAMPKRFMMPYSWSFDLVFQTGIYWSHYGEKGMSNPAFATGRDSASVSYAFYDAGFRIQRTNRNGTFYQAGLLYGQRRDQFGFVYSYDTPQMVIDSSDYYTIIDPVLPPQIIRNYDTSIVMLRESKQLKHEVSMQYWRFPVRAGIRFPDERMVFSISCGLDFGLVKARGIVINPLQMENVELSNGTIYRSGLMIDVALSLGWEWKLAEKVSFLAEPFLTKSVTNLYSDREYGSSRPFQAVILTGFRFKP